MSHFVLVPGAGGDAGYWRYVVPELEALGDTAVAVELPGGSDDAGLEEYATLVAAAVGAPTDVVVAQSLGGFSAPLACARTPVRLLVLVNAMIPAPGESAGAWWDATGSGAARAEYAAAQGLPPDFELMTVFFHDVPEPRLSEVLAGPEPAESDAVFATPWPLSSWPDVPTTVLSCSEDRLFPLAFQQRVARDRLGIEPDVMPGGHLPAFSRPAELAQHLSSYAA